MIFIDVAFFLISIKHHHLISIKQVIYTIFDLL